MNPNADYDYEDNVDDELLTPMDYVFPEEAFVEDNGSYSDMSPMTFWEVMENCVQLTAYDGFQHIGKLIFWCLLFRIASQSGIAPRWMSHVFSIISGLFVLTHFFYLNTMYMLVLMLISYLVLYTAHRYKGSYLGPLTAFTCLVFNLVCELKIASPVDWHQIRGAQMILSMKIISLGFDMDEFKKFKSLKKKEEEEPKHDEEENFNVLRRNRRQFKKKKSESVNVPKEKPEHLNQLPSLLQYSGYGLNPGTSVFGPWTKYEDYLDIFDKPCWNFAWLLKILLSLLSGFVFLSISACWVSWLIKDNSWRWSIAYRDAMSFRASHYFVSFISEASAVAAGFGHSKTFNHWNDVLVSQPYNIEAPRSLVEVVVSWNVPMHLWLKTYCFKTTRVFGNFVAVFVTYGASAILHGLNFQLAAVLVSLGFYTYVEYGLRKKLAGIFDASVESRSDSKAVRVYKENSFFAVICNFCFGVLACFHLAYLGVMFDRSNDLEVEGYSLRHTLKKWDELGFLSHYVMGFTFIISLLI